ncbi:serine/threonine protein phosphatase [Macrococcoides canis]|uniref:metallophosphoesterase n=1 Tax=Macrococcoides canis TaxID=1855823 RepID=UPI001AEC227F|nr:metallophosphoesterase [Macrococcus canis]QTQ08615.1 serine/threonine protein phosphatase [Macrococcus canis]
MGLIYAMSDIHGHYEAFIEALSKIDLSNKNNKLILLGDYINNGDKSLEVIEKVMALENEYPEQVITLLGNHDEMLINWLLLNDFCHIDEKSLQSFFDSNDLATLDETDLIRVFMKKHPKITNWLKRNRTKKRYYETEDQIFVHAGINEDNDDSDPGSWKYETSDYEWTGKYPPTIGSFYKDVIAGHVYAHQVADNLEYSRKIYHDGESHYYIDGDVQSSGIIPILVFDTDTKTYHYIEKENE